MGDRLDVVVIDDAGLRIHHQRFGAGALMDLLLAGPARAPLLAADGFVQTHQLDDDVAACVIDLVRSVLVIAGPIEAISASGQLHPQPQQLLGELAVAWPGWRLAYEPDDAIAPIVAYAASVGLALDALNPPGTFAGCTFTLEVPAGAGTAPGQSSDAVRGRLLADLADALSIRAANELEQCGLVTVGDFLDRDDAALAHAGISDRVRREVAEVVAALS